MNKEYYLFSWGNIPGEDNEKLVNHLEKCLKLNWVKNADIHKSDDNTTITLTSGKHTLILRLENIVLLELGIEETYKYAVQKENGKLNVYNNEARLILRELNSEDDEGFERLANIITERSREAPRVVVNTLRSDDQDDVDKARTVLLNMGDLVLTPMLDGLSPTDPDGYAWDIEAIVDIQMENRVKIAKALENMLEDKRSLEMPELPPGTEESYVPRRVCDEAFLLMYRLLSFETSEEEQFFSADVFLNMADNVKDAEINRVKTSKRWILLAEQIDEFEE
jgi:hypothetical protein